MFYNGCVYIYDGISAEKVVNSDHLLNFDVIIESSGCCTNYTISLRRMK